MEFAVRGPVGHKQLLSRMNYKRGVQGTVEAQSKESKFREGLPCDIEARLEDRSHLTKEAGLRDFETEGMACAQRDRHKVKSVADSRKLSKFGVVGAKGESLWRRWAGI